MVKSLRRSKRLTPYSLPLTRYLNPARYWGWRRYACLAGIGLIAGTIVAPVANYLITAQRYVLAANETSLVGGVNPNLAAKISYDAASQTYQFNKAGKRSGDQSPAAKLQAQAGGGGKKDDSLYSVDLPADLGKGATYYDNNLELSFSLTPSFTTQEGKQQAGRLVYPLANGQAVYTPKTNGLKEDILLTSAPLGGSASYAYTLNLPDTLEARMIDNTGAVGIYSADPALFGDITFGSDADQQQVQNARKNAKKDHLVFALPAPVVKEADCHPERSEGSQNCGGQPRARFTLRGNTLTVVAGGLKQAHYPISIDPSVVVTSSSDFGLGGNNEGSIDFPSGQVSRSHLTGGTVSGGWNYTHNSTNDGTAYVSGLPAGRYFHTTVAYNGYLYVIGGSGAPSDVQYAPINSNGTIGSWTATTSLAVGRQEHTSVAYNGYLYVLGGYSGSAPLNDVQFAPINSDGTLGSWHYTHNNTDDGATFVSGFATPRFGHTSVAYNGYLYVIGGQHLTSDTACSASASIYCSDVQYAPINANGTVGAWVSTTSFTNGRSNHVSVAYNGYLYVMGGTNGGVFSDVQYSPINSNGSVGAWTATSSFATGRSRFTGVVYNGYLYIMAGSDTSSNMLSDTQYAPINTNGSIGAWSTTASIITARTGPAAAFYNGYLYITGGMDAGSNTLADVQYAKIDSPGVTTGYTSTTAIPSRNCGLLCTATGRDGATSVAYNGYLYLMGGQDSNATIATVQYAAINNDGTIGSWTSTSSMTTARYRGSSALYGGCVYNMGGQNNSGTVLGSVEYNTFNVGGSLNTWTTTTALPNNRTLQSSVAYNGYLYLLGGSTGGSTGGLSDVWYAPIASNCTIGSWVQTTSLPLALSHFAAVATGNFLYVLGGVDNSSNVYNTVYYAPINTNGTIGSWQTTSSFTNARQGLAAVSNKGYLYIMGGGSYADVQYAPINADGTLGSWSATVSLPSARYDEGTVVYKDYLYGIGGYSGSTHLSDVQVARINNGGPGGTTAFTASTSITTARGYGITAAFNGYLYTMGGWDGTNYYNDVQYAPINANGSLGAWQYTCNSASSASFVCGFTGPRYAGIGFAYNGYLYMGSGFGSNTYYSNIQFAPINPDGTVGAWQYTCNSASTPAFVCSFNTGRYFPGSTVYNGRLYVLGGWNSVNGYLNDVQYAPINADGTLGSWSTTTSFPTARYAFGTVAANGYLYMIGGYDGTNYHQDVLYAPVNSDGSLGSWSTTMQFPFGSWLLQAVANNGYLYVIGGAAGTNLSSGVYYAPMHANGTLGAWIGGSAGLNVARASEITVYDNIAYVVAGDAGNGTWLSDTRYASFTAIPRTGRYSKLVDLGTASALQSISYNGGLPGGSDSIAYRMAGTSGVFGSAYPSGNMSGEGNVCSTGPPARYVELVVNLDDSGVAAFPDSAGSAANVTDITVNYTAGTRAPTNLRLRGGKFFQNQTQQPLDTCGP